MLLIQSLVNQGDLTVRVHIRSQMDSSGLRRIIEKHAVFDHPQLQRVINDYLDDAKNDELEITETMKEDVKMNFSDPKGVFEAVLANTDGRALDFFSSTMKHLLLVPTDSEGRLRYFQLIDKLVSSVVTDRKGLDGDFTSLLGSSVAQIVSKFGDQERLEDALDDASNSKVTIARLRREREALEEELSQKDQGLVGQLKTEVSEVKRALDTSRSATEALQGEVAEAERVAFDKITALELANRQLFDMLSEANVLGSLGEDGDMLDRRELIALMEKKVQRSKAIKRLEGFADVSSAEDSTSLTDAEPYATVGSPTNGTLVSEIIPLIMPLALIGFVPLAIAVVSLYAFERPSSSSTSKYSIRSRFCTRSHANHKFANYALISSISSSHVSNPNDSSR